MDERELLIFSILLAYLADLLFGDPVKLPHPIVAFGKSISYFEKKLNKKNYKYLKGAFTSVFLCLVTFFVFYYLMTLIKLLNLSHYIILNALFLFYGLANKTLIKEGKAVFIALRKQGLQSGRQQLSRIVGRDTSQLSENQIKTAVLETLSENLSDGVVAPLFYYAIGGIPALMTYKMVNTLDSMIAYKNEKYHKFGFFAAKIDDVANFLPARLTAFLMALISFNTRSFKFILKYGNAHSSPNSGYPESALAGILNCRFGGSNIYNGKTVHKPYIGDNQRNIKDLDLEKTIRINHLVCLIMIVFVCFKTWFIPV